VTLLTLLSIVHRCAAARPLAAASAVDICGAPGARLPRAYGCSEQLAEEAPYVRYICKLLSVVSTRPLSCVRDSDAFGMYK
jgi:hypothetical protein